MFGWPLLNTIALQTVPASHAAVVNGILPLCHCRHRRGLAQPRVAVAGILGPVQWLAPYAGLRYAWQRAHGNLHAEDALMLVSMLLGGLGYASGAIATRYLTGPLQFLALISACRHACCRLVERANAARCVGIAAWGAFVYPRADESVDRFFFWYRGLALGGIARVSQVQLLQPFFTPGFAALLFGEAIEPAMTVVALLTCCTDCGGAAGVRRSVKICGVSAETL